MRWLQLGLSLVLSGCAELCAAANDIYRLQPYALEEGLSQMTVTALVEDDQGFLWIGTQDGLNRFDGHRFKVYRHVAESDEGVASSSIDALALDARSRLWIGTNDAGLVIRDLRSDAVVQVGARQALSHPTVLRIVVDGDAGAWVATAAGLDYVNAAGDSVRRLVESEPILGLVGIRAGEALAIDRQCRLWRVDSAHAREMDLALPEPAQCLALLGDGEQVWVATRQQGLLQLDQGGRIQSRHPASDLREEAVELNAAARRSDGQLLLGYEDGLVQVFAPASAEVRALRSDQALRAQISAFHESGNGVLWIGTQNRGLWRARLLSPAVHRDLPDDPAIADWPSRSIRSIWRDGEHWLVGTDQGLLLQGSDGVWQRNESIGTTSVRRILPTAAADGWWIGTHRGLWHLDRQGHAEPVTELPHPQVTDLLWDGDSLWMATRGGLGRLHEGRLDQEGVPESLRTPFLTALLRDRQGRLWIASNERGVFRLDPDGNVEHLHPGNGRLPHNSIWSLHENDAALWLGSFGGGLLRIDHRSGALRSIGRAQGLSNEVVYRIEEDAAGRLWLSSNHGLNVYDPGSGQIQVLLPEDGLRNREYNSGASFRESDARMYFGGTEGLDVVTPPRLADRSPPARPVLTELRVLARQGQQGATREARSVTLAHAERVALNYRDTVFSVDMVGIDFSGPDTTRLRYRISGLHSDWVEPAGGRSELLLSYLPPGSYRLELQAAGRDGRFGDSRSLELIIQPPPWRHPLAFAAYALVAALMLAGLASRIGASSRAKRAQIALLNRTVAERTAELERANLLLMQSNRQLEQATRTDPLTQVSNRRDLQDWLSRESAALEAALGEAREVQPLLFFLLDIDDFKRINDSRGHAVGDAVLVEFAARLRRLCREHDVVVRWGGEEFLLMVRGLQLADAAHLAERLRRTIADAPVAVDAAEPQSITCSIGFAPWPFSTALPEAARWEDSINLADRSLYAAKRAGKNAWVGLLPGPELDRGSLQALFSGTEPEALPAAAIRLLRS